MSSDRNERLRAIFDEALSMAGDERDVYVARACADDNDLRRHVMELLSDVPDTVDLPVTPIFDTVPDESGETALPTVAGYDVRGKIGAGGMGTVYEAVQRQTGRRVALKVVRQQRGDDDLRARMFKREIETLALLTHPGIATLYEAMETQTGQLCFAMELIEGEPLDTFFSRQSSGVNADSGQRDQALRLFAELCNAVHYAHQRGVIHRDLKPSNILVTSNDGSHQNTAQPHALKVLDFGLARLADENAEQTQYTEVGSVRGTLRYMSPEQAAGDRDAVDVRTDVYSLGVILYQLLTDRFPHDLQGLSLVDALRKIATEDPTPPIEYRGDLPIDLEVIASKSVAQDPAERYQSANALADDIQRFLNVMPIAARAPSAAYQLRKLIRRHQLAFGVALLALIATVAAAIGLGVLYARAESNLQRAEIAEASALREAQVAQRVSGFLTSLFEVSDPSQSRGETVTARELLDTGVERIDRELATEPLVNASLKTTMGEVYRSLGLYDSAEPLLTDARQTIERETGPDSADLLPALSALAGLRYDQGRYEESQQLAERLIAEIERLYGPDHNDMGNALGLLSAALTLQGKFEESEQVALASVEKNQAAFGEAHANTANSLRKLGALYTAMQRYDDAATTIDRELSIRETLPDDELGLAGALHERAEIHARQREYEQAEQRYRETLAIQERILGPDHPSIAFEYNNLGIVYRRMKRPDEAEAAYRRALEIREKALAPDHPMIAWTLDNLGLLLAYENRLDEAEPLLLRAQEIAEKAVGTNHPDYGIVLNNLARLRERQGRLDEAAELQLGQINIIRKHFEPTNLNLGVRLNILAEILRDQGKIDEALTANTEALGIFRHHNDATEIERAEKLEAELNQKLLAD